MNATIIIAEMLVLPEVMPILGATKEDWVKLELGQTAIIAVLLQMWLHPVKSVSTSVWEEVNFIIGVIKKQLYGDFGKLTLTKALWESKLMRNMGILLANEWSKCH